MRYLYVWKYVKQNSYFLAKILFFFFSVARGFFKTFYVLQKYCGHVNMSILHWALLSMFYNPPVITTTIFLCRRHHHQQKVPRAATRLLRYKEIIIDGHRHRDQCRQHRHSGIWHLSPVPEHSGTGLDTLIPVPDCSRYRHFNSFRYLTDGCSTVRHFKAIL
jgi:hypothetical protein